MSRKDKKLDQLLRNLEVDRPSKDFTDDIMQMIAAESLETDDIHSDSLIKTTAPMHMTDLVMEEILNENKKSYHLLTTKEISIAVVLFAIITATLLISTPSSISSFNSTVITQNIQSIVSATPTSVFVILICGTALYAIDQLIRVRLVGR